MKTSLAQAVRYLRNLASADPQVQPHAQVINIDRLFGGTATRETLVFDLEDGMSIRLDIEIYDREVSV